MELAVTSLLWTFMAEHRARVVQSLRSRIQQVVFQCCTYTGSGTFRTQCQALAVEVIQKGVHLLPDNVGYRTDGTHEQVGLLDDRQTDVAVTTSRHPLTHGLLKEFPKMCLVRQDIVHPADGLDGSSHCLISSGILPARTHQRSGETPRQCCRL